MKFIKPIVIVFYLSLLCSCHTVVGNWLGKYADYHLTYGEENANKGLFRVDGCYIAYTKEEIKSDTIYGSMAFAFYPDGVCVQLGLNFVVDNGIIDFDKSIEREKLYPNQWHEKMGVYALHNDTVYCEMYRWTDLLHVGTECEGYRFKITDSCTLECNRTMSKIGDFNWHFIPCTNIVYPRAKFIKDRKWIWKTKEDWLKYKESKKKQK